MDKGDADERIEEARGSTTEPTRESKAEPAGGRRTGRDQADDKITEWKEKARQTNNQLHETNREATERSGKPLRETFEEATA